MPSIPEYSGEFQAMNNTENMPGTLLVISNSVDSILHSDSTFPSMTDSLKISSGQVTISGMQDTDYPNLEQYGSSLKTLSQFVGLKTVPLPKSLLEQFGGKFALSSFENFKYSNFLFLFFRNGSKM